MKQSYNQMLNSMPSITYYAIENNKPYTYAIHVILHFPLYQRAKGDYRKKFCIETKPHPQPLPEEGGEWLAVKMEEIILGLKGCSDVVDNEA